MKGKRELQFSEFLRSTTLEFDKDVLLIEDRLQTDIWLLEERIELRAETLPKASKTEKGN